MNHIHEYITHINANIKKKYIYFFDSNADETPSEIIKFQKKVSKKTKIIFGISLLFGGSTLFFRNEEFLFWRPTVINWIFSVLLLSVEFFSGKNLILILKVRALKHI